MGSARIGVRIATATVVAVAVLLAYSAARSSEGYTFAQSNGFNLTIDSQASYNGVPVPNATWALKNLTPGSDKFFNFSDIKPGDQGENTISLHVNMNAFACLDFTNLQNAENGINEPESHVDGSSSGELAQEMEFFAWRDDGDNLFEVGESPLFGPASAQTVLNNKKYTLADSNAGPSLTASSTAYVGIMWCAGDLAVNIVTAVTSCDPTTMANEAQTDSFSVDIAFRAATVDQGDFRCQDPQGGGLGQQIGLFVKCEKLAQMGWPIPSYKTECPGGFGQNSSQSSQTNAPSSQSKSSPSSSGGSRTPRTR